MITAAETFGDTDVDEEAWVALSCNQSVSLRLISVGRAVLQAVSQSSRETFPDDGTGMDDLDVVNY